ncbi:unnamed protein product [Closterium sp. Naga37s-1]|nr:unnamed protein product [Closterium sp. Naga37s-1]
MARAMLGEIQEHDERQHERGHPLERRWVYPWEEEDERPAVYAEQEEIWLPGEREEQAVDKKREEFSQLEEAIERRRRRERYEREFGCSDFALMAATNEQDPEQGETGDEQPQGGTKAAQQAAEGPKEEFPACEAKPSSLAASAYPTASATRKSH